MSELRTRLDKKKEERAQLIGKRDQLLEGLKKEFSCSSIEEAVKLEQDLQEQIKARSQVVKDLRESILTKYPGLSNE